MPNKALQQIATRKHQQYGVAMVEFSLVAILFFTLLLSTVEFGRLLFTLNAANEATRLGARLAAVCSQNDPVIKARMRQLLGNLNSNQIRIDYFPDSCDVSSCKTVTAELVTADADGMQKAQFNFAVPFFAAAIDLPSFATSLPREFMNSTDANGDSNPACAAA